MIERSKIRSASIGSAAKRSAIAPTFWFLVVARNAVGDGSFGTDGAGHERPSPAPGSVCP